MPLMHNSFKDIKIHTAKCDTCNKHNTDTIKQCTDCGQNFCTPCWLARGSDGTHMLNSGDKGYAATQARMVAKATRARSLDLLKPKEEKVSRMKIPSPLGGRSKRTRRRTVVIEESESEDGGLIGDGMALEDVALDEDDGHEQLMLGAPPDMSEVRRGKQREVPLLKAPVPRRHGEPSGSRGSAGTQSDYSMVDSTINENEAANSLLELAAGSHNAPFSNFTPVNAGNNYGPLPGIDLSEYGDQSRCETIYSPVSPAYTNSRTRISNPPLPNRSTLSEHWFDSSANGTDLPASMQVHPYPANPEVTSKVVGHDSQGNFPQYPQRSRMSTGSNKFFNNYSHTPDNIIQQDAQDNRSLFIDSGSDEETMVMSAPLPDDPAWSSAPTTGLSDADLKNILEQMLPGCRNDVFTGVEAGMDNRGERLFGNEADGEIWDDPFNEHYFDRPDLGDDEHRAGAKANLGTNSVLRARRPQAPAENEGSEEGEIMDDEDMGND